MGYNSSNSNNNNIRFKPLYGILGSIVNFFKKIVYTNCGATQSHGMVVNLQKTQFWASELKVPTSAYYHSSNFFLVNVNVNENHYKFATDIIEYMRRKAATAADAPTAATATTKTKSATCTVTDCDGREEFHKSTMIPVKQAYCYFWISCKTVPDNYNSLMADIKFTDRNEPDTILETHRPNHTTNDKEVFCGYEAAAANYYPCKKTRFFSECSEDSFICFLDNNTSDFDDDETTSDEMSSSTSMESLQNDPSPPTDGKKVKKVRFDCKPTVHTMHTWDFAYRAARKGDWEMYARDRQRFQQRIARSEVYLNPILDATHRQKIYLSRFAEESVT